jgi:hypothetical protein
MAEIEQHAVTLRQFLAVHQAAFAFLVVGRKLDGKGMHAGRTDDLERILSGRACRGERGKDGADRDKERDGAGR